jgi:hypothetical protein
MTPKRILRSPAPLAAALLVSLHPVGAQTRAGFKISPPETRAPAPEPAPPAGAPDPEGWKTHIVTTTFWIGEQPTARNPMPNHISSWDMNWRENYGGVDHPERHQRVNFLPARFIPRQNPFYAALPYNDCTREGYKPEAERVIPWFKEGPQPGSKRSVCKGRWLAIRAHGKVAYAQWEDAGPFRTDHWQYVFGPERPKPNLNKGAGLDVSPAVRDYLGLGDTSITDWKFVEFRDVPPGPWADHGENNTFVLARRGQVRRAPKTLAMLLEHHLPEIMQLGRGGLPTPGTVR